MNRTPIIMLLLAVLASTAPAATKKKPPRRAPPAPPLVLAPAAGEQLAATALTYFGDYICEFDQRLQVSLNPRFDGYVDVRFGKQTYTLKPVLSTTGALRLEDVRGRLLLLQIAQKSMLLDVKAGQRLLDDCVNDQQAENRRAVSAAPPQPGLGITPEVTLTPPPAPTLAAAAVLPVVPAAPAAAPAAAASAASAPCGAAAGPCQSETQPGANVGTPPAQAGSAPESGLAPEPGVDADQSRGRK